jgi:SAM-dependent methyltransferase
MNRKQRVSKWWSENPMTYGSTHGRADYCDGREEIGSREFFASLDREFYSWNTPLHRERPFDILFPYGEFAEGAFVLEIGCGLGTMAMNWALNGAMVTAVDLNPAAVAQTKRRFELFELEGDIQIEDANHLSFSNQTFDYVYSWGVLHHSPSLERSISEMMRVLRSGGGFGIMLYNRESIFYRYMTKYIEGFLHYENRFLGPLELASRYGDGHREEGNPYTWPVTEAEIRDILSPYCRSLHVLKLGTELDGIAKLLLPGLGMILPRLAKKVWARRFGWSLWVHGYKTE